MHIHCLGLNHRTAEVGLREQLAFSEDAVRAALARLGCGSERNGCHAQHVTEMVILSTCNRVEIYALSPHRDFDALEAFLSDVQGVPQAQFAPHMYRMIDEEAVEHLFRVASGLDSLVLGEPQILGQVTTAFELARGQNAAGPVLSRLFQSALHTGKRARSETAISHNPASISSVAIHLASQSVEDIAGARIAVLGAGEMAELAVEALRKRGASQITVVNRTLERARLLADRWQGAATTFEKLSQAMAWADILITSTGAPHTLVHRSLVAQAMAQRSVRPLVIIDIAVPRDVDPDVANLPGVRLYDIDTLHAQLEASLARREHEVPHVEQILAEERESFLHYMRSLDLLPLIAEMRQRAEAIREAELEKTLRRLPHLTADDRERLDALTTALVKKLLHEPITRLRAEAGSPRAADYAEATRNLFGLEDGNGSNGSNGSNKVKRNEVRI